MQRRNAGIRAIWNSGRLGMWVGALAILLASWLAYAQTLNGFDLENSAIPAEEIRRGGPPRDGIPSIDHPTFVSAADADFLKPDDRVIGVHYQGIARAYPIAILNWHEVVNDRFGDHSVAITFCPLCGTGMVFRADIAGRALSFGVSGLLYQSDVLLYDRATQSLWSQLHEEAVTGPFKGQRLQALAADHTSWADWRERHPQTTVLSADTGFRRDYTRDPYAGYVHSEQLMFPVRFSDARLHPKAQVLGVSVGDSHKAYPYGALEAHGKVVEETVGGKALRVSYDAKHRSARVTDADGIPIPAVTAFWFAWYTFHPDTEVFTAGKAP